MMERSLDPWQVVAERQSRLQKKVQMLLLSVFGVIANMVSRQTREIGIRMVLGASPV